MMTLTPFGRGSKPARSRHAMVRRTLCALTISAAVSACDSPATDELAGRWFNAENRYVLRFDPEFVALTLPGDEAIRRSWHRMGKTHFRIIIVPHGILHLTCEYKLGTELEIRDCVTFGSASYNGTWKRVKS
jgi:hypothetical protein